ncbi:MAG: hypothetical protein GY927_22430 [bacterium]|nr:hypothetical protein [bacterium]
MKSLRIKALATLLISALLLSGASFIGSSLYIRSKVSDAEMSWRSYQDDSSIKARAIESLTKNLGFGGMIHQFKNYVLRQDQPRIKKVLNTAVSSLSSLDQYETAGISNKESRAIKQIRSVINLYINNMEKVQGLVNGGSHAAEIDKHVKISDKPALEGIAFLIKAVSGSRLSASGNITKSELLSKIRSALGYGNMIHQFKNYVLRQKPSRIIKIKNSITRVQNAILAYRKLETNASEEEALSAISGVVAKYDKNIKIAKKLTEQGKTPEELDSSIKINDKPALDGMSRLVTEIGLQNKIARQSLTNSLGSATFTSIIILVIAISSSAILTMLAYWVLVHRIASPIKKVTQIMTQLSKGETAFDLSQLEGDTEIGEMVNSIAVFRESELAKEKSEQDSIRESARFEADKAINSIKEIAQTMDKMNGVALNLGILDGHSRKVSGSSQTIVSAAEQLVASVDEISTNSEGASNDAIETDNTVSSGLSAAQSAMGAIQIIWDTMEDSVGSFGELTGASNQIEQILNVIEDIAEQTNLLALNATIEAARAGEAGKGFAVVALEVKNLANQSSKATEDIANRIQALKAGMESISSTMDKSREAVTAGRESIDKTANTMELAAQQVSSVSSKMTDITSILHQQKGSSSEISRSINEVAGFSLESQQQVELVTASINSTNEMMTEIAKSSFDGKSDRSLCEIAKIDHILFKKNIISIAMGDAQSNSSEISDHHNCRLGKWYDGLKLPHIVDLPSFKMLAKPHEAVHAAAKKALDAHNAGQVEGKLLAIEEMNAAGLEVLAILDQLSQAIGEHDNAHIFDEANKRKA